MLQFLLAPQRARWLFWLAIVGVSFLAFMPGDEVPVSTGWDKSNHALAFFVLAGLATCSWPTASAWQRCLGLIGYGVLIECVQYLVGRDAALLDVFADSIGLAIWQAVMLITRRQRLAWGS